MFFRGGALNFFSGRGVQPGFLKCGACELLFASEKGACELKISKFGGLWTENFQILGLVSWKFQNLGAWELKFWWKLRLKRLKFPNFLKRGSCELTLLLEMGPLQTAGEVWKGGLQGHTSPYPLSRSVPPGCFLKILVVILRTTELILGLFVLMTMHNYVKSKYGNTVLKHDKFRKENETFDNIDLSSEFGTPAERVWGTCCNWIWGISIGALDSR